MIFAVAGHSRVEYAYNPTQVGPLAAPRWVHFACRLPQREQTDSRAKARLGLLLQRLADGAVLGPAFSEGLWRGARHGRSLQGEARSVLENAAGQSIAEVLASARQWRKKLGRRFEDSARLIREDRER
jgi:hypothetical protein